jgi:hypothetical protein
MWFEDGVAGGEDCTARSIKPAPAVPETILAGVVVWVVKTGESIGAASVIPYPLNVVGFDARFAKV